MLVFPFGHKFARPLDVSRAAAEGKKLRRIPMCGCDESTLPTVERNICRDSVTPLPSVIAPETHLGMAVPTKRS